MSGRVGAGLTRRERSAIRKQAWAEANADLQVSFNDAGAAIGATPEARRAVRKRRQEARQQRDVRARSTAAAEIAAAEQRVGQGAGGSAPQRRQTAPRRQAAAINTQTEQTWQAVRPPSRAQKSKANRAAWAQLQLDRLTQTSAARTARRGKRRQAKSQTWLAAQAARLQVGLEPGLEATTGLQAGTTHETGKGGHHT